MANDLTPDPTAAKKIERIKSLAGRVVALTADPQPGIAHWWLALGHVLDELADER